MKNQNHGNKLSLMDIEQHTTGLTTPGISPVDNMETAGKKILLFQLGQMLIYQPIALAGLEIEGVHKMRVATRRMRTALGYLRPYFKQKTFKPIRKYLGRAGRVSGGVRDLDVINLVMETHGLTGAVGWQETFEEDYQNKRAPFVEMIQSPEHEKFIVGLYQFLTVRKWKYKNNVMWETLESLPEYYPALLTAKWDEINASYQNLAPEPYSRLHRLRIDLKRLRYLVEFFSEVTEPVITQKVILSIVSLQDHLGRLNDLHNTCALLENHLAGQQGIPAELKINLDQLIEFRDFSAKEFIPVWEEFRLGDFPVKLTSLI